MKIKDCEPGTPVTFDGSDEERNYKVVTLYTPGGVAFGILDDDSFVVKDVKPDFEVTPVIDMP